jgi:septal ring factor EnvC (AmiA/AmiB activator)
MQSNRYLLKATLLACCYFATTPATAQNLEKLESQIAVLQSQINNLKAQLDYQNSQINGCLDKTSQLDRNIQQLREFTTPRPTRPIFIPSPPLR